MPPGENRTPPELHVWPPPPHVPGKDPEHPLEEQEVDHGQERPKGCLLGGGAEVAVGILGGILANLLPTMALEQAMLLLGLNVPTRPHSYTAPVFPIPCLWGIWALALALDLALAQRLRPFRCFAVAFLIGVGAASVWCLICIWVGPQGLR